MKQLVGQMRSQLDQSGIEGLIDTIDKPHHRPLTRLLLAVDKRFIGFAQFAREFVYLEKQLESKSVPEVAREFLDYLALELHSNQQFAEFSLPDQPAILLGLNHESIVEPVFLASLLNRNDIRFFGMAVTQYLGPHIAEYVLPVLPKKMAIDIRSDKKPTLSDRLNWVFWLYSLESRTVEEIERLNRRSIEQAAVHLDAGGVLIIFPGGGVDIQRPWYRGLGVILSLMSPEILHSTPMFPISTTGLSRKLLYKKVHQAAFDRRRQYSIQANLLDPIYIHPWTADYTPQQLLDYLKEETMVRQMSVNER